MKLATIRDVLILSGNFSSKYSRFKFEKWLAREEEGDDLTRNVLVHYMGMELDCGKLNENV